MKRLFPIMVLLVSCSGDRSAILGSWTCPVEPPRGAVDFTGTFSLTLLSSGRAALEIEMGGLHDGKPLEADITGEGTWNLAGDRLELDYPDLTLASLTLDGQSYEDRFGDEFTDTFPSMIESSRIEKVTEDEFVLEGGGIDGGPLVCTR